jgi:hypothetical protein
MCRMFYVKKSMGSKTEHQQQLRRDIFEEDGICHGLSLSCLTCNRASPSVRCDYSSYTSAVYSHSCISTVCSFTKYNLSSILQFSAHAHCSLHRDRI